LLNFKEMLCPELRAFAPVERAGAWREATALPFDAVELLGIAAALVGVTALTRYAAPQLAANARLAPALSQALIGLPLLLVALGPFLVRRLRRNLRAILARRQSAEHNPPSESASQRPRLP